MVHLRSEPITIPDFDVNNPQVQLELSQNSSLLLTDSVSKDSIEFPDHYIGLDPPLQGAHFELTKAPVEYPGHFELALSTKRAYIQAAKDLLPLERV